MNLPEIKITADEVQAELARLAFSNMFDVVESMKDGKFRVKGNLPLETQAAVARLAYRDTKDGAELEVEMHDKLGALKALAKWHGIDLSEDAEAADAEASADGEKDEG